MRILLPLVLFLLASGLSAAPPDPFDRELLAIERDWRAAGGDREAAVAVRDRLTSLEAKGPFRPRFWFLWGRISHTAGDFHAAAMGFGVARRLGFKPRAARENFARSFLFWLLEKPPAEKASRHTLVASFEEVRTLVAEILADPATGATVREEFARLEIACLEAMGTVNQLARNAARTLEIYEELVRRRPKNYQYRMSLSRAFIGQKRWPEALEAAEFARKLNPDEDWITVHAALGTIYSNLGQPDVAERHYATFLAENPENTRVMRRFGEHYFRHGQFGPGVEIYRRIIQLEPDDPAAYHMIATGLRRLGDTEQAEEYEEIYRRKEGATDRHRGPGKKKR